MVVGAGSASYRTLRYLVQRLPAMIGPAWLERPTQPIGIDDVIAYLAAAPDVPASEGREIQIGGPDVLSYGDMIDLMADALGAHRRPRIRPWPARWLTTQADIRRHRDQGRSGRGSGSLRRTYHPRNASLGLTASEIR